METRGRKTKKIVHDEGIDKEYLGKIFIMIKQMENISVVSKKSRFNSSEIRLITEVIMAQYSGKRLISTQLATKLGITRSAISQIVNKLESENIIRRVPDEVDKKIAYIELSGKSQEAYEEEIALAQGFVGRIIDEFGVTKLDKLLALAEEFSETINELRNQ